MKARYLLMALGCLSIAGCGSKNDADKSQESWMIVSARSKGQPISEFENTKVTINANEIIFHGPPKETHDLILKLDADKNPKQLVMTIPRENEVDAVIPGIYESEGDKWKICLADYTFNDFSQMEIKPGGRANEYRGRFKVENPY